MVKILRVIERCIPLDSKIVNFFKSNRPDVFLVTPLIDIRVSQLNWLKGAMALGIKSALCVASWDNLSNKSMIQVEPDAVFVWNEIQQQEAVRFHRIPVSKITVTGAQCYDRLFARQPATTRGEFCEKVGLSEGPYILYLCSSGFIAPQEVEFITNWVERLRNATDRQVSQIGILVRPHPQNASQWRDVDFSTYDNVAIYPRGGANPIHGGSLDDFFDSMYYSAATIGINTSPMIESGILNKPVLTVLTPQFTNTQSGTIHFHHLVNGGLLSVARDLEEHLEQLGQLLADPESYQKRIRQFIQNFVRPHGLDLEATPIFVQAIEDLHRRPVSPPIKAPPWQSLVRSLLFPWAALTFSFRKFKYYLRAE
jgi:hypothetical protein